ncbi:hypothetical protein [Pseudomonas laurentiana]
MNRATFHDVLVKPCVSTTQSWGEIKVAGGPSQQVYVAEYVGHAAHIVPVHTTQSSDVQNAIWVHDRHNWRSAMFELSVKSSVTELDTNAQAGVALQDLDSTCKMLYHWESHKQGRIASVYAVFFIEKNYAARNLEVINSLMLEVSTRHLTEWSMVAILRSSYSARHMLPAWKTFYRAVKEALAGNERAPRLLAGLDD